jgi:hypothetical protein
MNSYRLIFISMILFVTSACSPRPTPTPCAPIQRGLDFLISQLNPNIGLLHDSPRVKPHIYWLTNDNALAAYVFAQLGKPDLATTITETIKKYGQPSNGLIEVVWGMPIDFPPHIERVVTVARVGADEIQQEFHTDGARFEDWADYANLAFLGALNESARGNSEQARKIFNQTMTRFDETGFPDRGYAGSYETYKVALALYVGVKIRALSPDQRQKLLTVLLARQAPSGGFFTNYPDSEGPGRDTNTETTSFALLALNAAGCE